MSTGWIKLHRKIKECYIWENNEQFDRRSAWIDLLLSANHQDKKILLGNEAIEVKRGSFVTSELKLMDRWKWSKTKVRGFLDMLQNDGMIVKISDKKKTTINIVNYNVYQEVETIEKPQKDHKETMEEPQKDTNKNDKNYKNDKKLNNTLVDQCETLWSMYPKKKGKGTAIKRIPKLIREFSYEEIERTINRYIDEIKLKGIDIRFVKQGDTFFNAGYVDYLDKNYRGECVGTINNQDKQDERTNQGAQYDFSKYRI